MSNPTNALQELRALVATYLEGSEDAPRAAVLLDEVEQAESKLQTMLENAGNNFQAMLEIAAHFQDDYIRKLPVITAFRQWRNGIRTTEEFLSRLREDDLFEVLRIEPVPLLKAMKGLEILNDHRDRVRR